MPLFLQPFAKYAIFTGRARRAEYWWFNFAQGMGYALIIALAVTGGSLESGMSALLMGGGLFALACLLPNLAVTVRRLHDTDRSALWLLLYAPGILSASIAISQMSAHHGIPATNPIFSGLASIANLALLIFMDLPGTAGPNRFGGDPKGGGMDISRVFDVPEEPVPHQEDAAPYKPVFDFGPTGKTPNEPTREPFNVPVMQTPVSVRPATGFSAPVRPVFGKRGR